MRLIATALALTMMACLLPLSAAAQNQPAPTLLETFTAWEAYQYETNGSKVCFLLSKPTAMRPSDRKHGDVFFFLSTRPSENVVNEASVLVGYPFAADSNVTVDVDGRTFSLFTMGDGAWVESLADEQQLVQAMRAGSSMTVSGTSARGTETSYTFSLSGVTAGSNRIANCS